METFPATIALVISGMALAISAITAWLTFFRVGSLKMTRPSLIFFGYDTTPGRPYPKVFLRGLLFSTSKKGQLIESMYLRLTRGESVQNFFSWFHGETNKLSVGSGLFVGSDGVATNHHFVLSPDQSNFSFQPGTYRMEVFGNVVGRTKVLLFESELVVSLEQSEALRDIESGLHFNWGPESQKYYPYLDKRHEHFSPKELFAMLPKSDEISAGKDITR